MISAKVVDGVVVNVAVGLADGHVECPSDVQVGWAFDGDAWTPSADTPPAVIPVMAVADWIELWPAAKRVAAFRAAQTDDTMADALMLLQAQNRVRLRGHTRTEDLMAYVVSAGYLTQAEADNLLDGLPAESERP